VSENSEIHLFLDNESESDEEKEVSVSEMEEIREFLNLTGGSRSEDLSSFSRRMSTEVIEIEDSSEVIREADFNSWESLKRVVFSTGNHLKEIAGFRYCKSLFRIEIPSSVEVIRLTGFSHCTSLGEIVFCLTVL
jgi:hypothetical protein